MSSCGESRSWRALLRVRDEVGAGIHVDDLRLRGIDGAVPAAAERLVERDVVGGDRNLALDQRVLGGVERALGIQDLEKVDRTGLVEHARQARGLAVAIDGRREGLGAPRSEGTQSEITD